MILKVAMLGSVGMAINSLILYLYNFYTDIKAYQPLWKFLSIKIVLFLSIWQRNVLEFISLKTILPLEFKDSEINIGVDHYLDNFLISFEMFILSLIIQRCYSYSDFEKGMRRNAERYHFTEALLELPKIL